MLGRIVSTAEASGKMRFVLDREATFAMSGLRLVIGFVCRTNVSAVVVTDCLKGRYQACDYPPNFLRFFAQFRRKILIS